MRKSTNTQALVLNLDSRFIGLVAFIKANRAFNMFNNLLGRFKMFAFYALCGFLLSSIFVTSNANDIKIIKIGITPGVVPEILRFIAPSLKEKGVELKIIEFTDYVTPNLALNNKSLDANYMQHKPFLDKISKDKKLNFSAIANIHIEPIGGYSTKLKSISELKNGATIMIPNDATNGARALILLHNNAIIKLKDANNLLANEFDILENTKNIKIKHIEAGLLPKLYKDADLAIINGNYSMSAGLKAKDALILEDSRSPYGNVLVVRQGDENKEEIVALKEALQSNELREFIIKKYEGEIVPAF